MFDLLGKRRSVRSYMPRGVEDAKVEEIVKAAMMSQSAMNRRPWQFVVVRDSETKRRLAEATVYSGHVAEAPVVIAVCADEAKASRWVEDCAIVAENIALEVTNQGLGTCWTQIREGHAKGHDAEAYVREVLGIPEGFRVLCLLPIGYPAQELPLRGEELFEPERVHNETW